MERFSKKNNALMKGGGGGGSGSVELSASTNILSET